MHRGRVLESGSRIISVCLHDVGTSAFHGFPFVEGFALQRRQQSFFVYKHSPLPLKGRHLTTTLMFPPPPIGAAPGAMVSREWLYRYRGASQYCMYIYRLAARVTKELSKEVRDSSGWACLNSRSYSGVVTASERPNMCFPDPAERQRHSFYHAPGDCCGRVKTSSCLEVVEMSVARCRVMLLDHGRSLSSSGRR